MYIKSKEEIYSKIYVNDNEMALNIAQTMLRNEIMSNDHKAEMHRLKVLIYSNMGKVDEANTSCLDAVGLCYNHHKTWSTWALFCLKNFITLKNHKWAE